MSRFAATVAVALALSACASTGAPPPSGAGGPEMGAPDAPDLARASIQAAEAAARAGEPGQAAAIYRRAYERSPSADLATRLARALRHAGDAQSGVLVLQEAERRFPSDAALLTELGRCALAGGYLPEAGEALAKAASLPGAGWDSFMVGGAHAARTGDFDAAEALFRRALEAASSTRDSMSAMANLALLRAERGDIRGAIAGLEDLARRPGAHPRVHADLALLHGLSGDAAGFRREAARALRSPEEIERAARWVEGAG